MYNSFKLRLEALDVYLAKPSFETYSAWLKVIDDYWPCSLDLCAQRFLFDAVIGRDKARLYVTGYCVISGCPFAVKPGGCSVKVVSLVDYENTEALIYAKALEFRAQVEVYYADIPKV